MDKKFRVLVTGGCGFIGSHIAEKMADAGYDVVIFDDLSSGTMENITHLSGRVKFFRGDVRNKKELRGALSGAGVVFHEAAFVSVPESEKDPSRCFDINLGGTISLLEEAERAGVEKVIFASSCAVYGNNEDLPLTENAGVSPGSPYAVSKSVAEQLMKEYCVRRPISITALRYFNVYGPRQNPDSKYAAVVSKFISDGAAKKALSVEGDGSQTRDFVFVGDVAEANMRAAQASLKGFHAINVCSGKEASVMDLAKNMSLLIGNVSIEQAPPRANDIARSWGSGEKALDLLGFSPKTSLIEGLKITVESYLERKLR